MTVSDIPETEKKKKRCCFSGHRPQKLQRPADDIRIDLENRILDAVRDGYTVFITGMACGTDIWAGNIVLRLKVRYPELRLVAAVPFPGFTDRWSIDWRDECSWLLDRADFVKIVSPSFTEDAYRLRNEWMVSRSSRLIAVCNGEPGGTRATLDFARQSGLECQVIEG